MDKWPAVETFKRALADWAGMGVTISPPTERICERCGRHDVWDEERNTWVIATEDGEKRAGDPQCLHEWDINGSYNPIADADADS